MLVRGCVVCEPGVWGVRVVGECLVSRRNGRLMIVRCSSCDCLQHPNALASAVGATHGRGRGRRSAFLARFPHPASMPSGSPHAVATCLDAAYTAPPVLGDDSDGDVAMAPDGEGGAGSAGVDQLVSSLQALQTVAHSAPSVLLHVEAQLLELLRACAVRDCTHGAMLPAAPFNTLTLCVTSSRLLVRAEGCAAATRRGDAHTATTAAAVRA